MTYCEHKWIAGAGHDVYGLCEKCGTALVLLRDGTEWPPKLTVMTAAPSTGGRP